MTKEMRGAVERDEQKAISRPLLFPSYFNVNGAAAGADRAPRGDRGGLAVGKLA